METAKKRRSAPKTILVVFLSVLALVLAIPLVCAGLSFIGRIPGDSILPENRIAYAYVPSPLACVSKLLNHEGLGDVLSEPSLAPVAVMVEGLRTSGVLESRWARILGNGALHAVALDDGSWFATYDCGLVSPALRVLPSIVGKMTVPGLYYVNAGKNSRFEYRMDGLTVYAAPYRNLVIATNSSSLLEATLAGTEAADGTVARGGTLPSKRFRSSGFDLGILLSAQAVLDSLQTSDPAVSRVLSSIKAPGEAELAVNIEPKRLVISLGADVSSPDPSLQAILSRESSVPTALELLPDSTQYCTVLSAGSLGELAAAARSLDTGNLSGMLDTADSSARMLFSMGIDELLYSWTGTEFALFAFAGRPRPVVAISIADEKKRKDVFARVIDSIAVSEDDSVVLEGMRLPRIKLPGFLEAVLSAFGVSIPSPYYAVQDGFLFLSESPENVYETVTAIRKNAALLKSDTWKLLSPRRSDRSALSVFYSLDRSVPFFLKGNTAAQRALQLYRQGFANVSFHDGTMSATLSVISGAGKGVVAIPGFPVDLGGLARKRVDAVAFGKKGDSRIFTVIDGTTLVSLDPVKGSRAEAKFQDDVWCAVARDIPGPRGLETDPLVWAVSSRGQVSLLDGNLKPLDGFPLATGKRVSGGPVAFDGKIWFADTDSGLNSVDSSGGLTLSALPFADALRSPPTFMSVDGRAVMAAYPKSFAGQLWLIDMPDAVRPGWPVDVSGIAYGSPVLFVKDKALMAAFVTQAGELSVLDSDSMQKSGFPLALSGVFYAQPAWDGTYLWLLSAGGTIFRVALDGTVLEQAIGGLSAEEGSLTLADIDGDRVPEVFASGDGNSLLGYTRSFEPLGGFPLPVWGEPFFGDMNGDGKTECIGVGIDNKLYGWQFR